jgi:hypothetical protein
MKKILVFSLIVIIILTAGSWITSAAYGHTNDNAGMNADANGEINVEAAPQEAAPIIEVFGNYIGGVIGGDLFYITANETQLDFGINLYITNTDQLVKSYKYLILKVAVYVKDGNGQWLQVTEQNGMTLPDAYITLETGPVNFVLPGLANYKVTIESGSYKSYPRTSSGDTAPQFYLNVENL